MHVDGRTSESVHTDIQIDRLAVEAHSLIRTPHSTCFHIYRRIGDRNRPAANELMSTVRTLYKTTPLYLISVHSFQQTWHFYFFKTIYYTWVFIINMLVKKIEYKFHNRMSMNI